METVTMYNREGSPIQVTLKPGDQIAGDKIRDAYGNYFSPEQYVYQNATNDAFQQSRGAVDWSTVYPDPSNAASANPAGSSIPRDFADRLATYQEANRTPATGTLSDLANVAPSPVQPDPISAATAAAGQRAFGRNRVSQSAMTSASNPAVVTTGTLANPNNPNSGYGVQPRTLDSAAGHENQGQPPTTGTLVPPAPPVDPYLTNPGARPPVVPPPPTPPPTPPPGGGAFTPTPGVLRVRMPDGTTRDFNSITADLDTVLRAGGIPIDPISGQDMALTTPFGPGGGYLVDGLPLNVVLGQGFLPGQLQKLLDQSFEGTLMASYPGQFNWDPSKIAEDPGYQFALAEGEKGIERGASANLSLLSGKTLKDLERFRTGLASTYSNNYYDRADRDFARDYNVFENTQGNRFNRLAAVSGLGQTAINQLDAAGSNYAGNAGNIQVNTGNQNADLITQAGNARASQFASQGNTWANFNPTGNLSDLALLDRYMRR